MDDTETEVLVVGAGPVGLTAAAELRRRGVGCRIVDRLEQPQPYAKAVGIQPRTLEVWEAMGLVGPVLDEAVPLLGQLTFVDGEPGPRLELELPAEVPYRFAALPQDTTERLLTEHLAGFGTRVERGTELLGLDQGLDRDDDHVRAELATPDGPAVLRARYVLGCDGAHSRVRRAIGVGFAGDAFPERYMLGDVEVDWDLPRGYGVRCLRRTGDGTPDDVLVCIPLPGHRRYRMSMLVPAGPEEAADGSAAEEVTHGLAGGRGPGLADIQAVLDRLSPRPATAGALRWSSVFRISHRLADRYRVGRVFLAGDAAHIHPPTGAQGMNTGVQDAWNLAWKLALALRGVAAEGLLDSYHAERHPVGAEVVGRTVRHARGEADADDPTTVLLRQAQLLVNYRGGPLSGGDGAGGEDGEDGGDGATGAGPRAGDRAPDCTGLERPLTAFPQRLFDLLRARPHHTLLLYAAAGPDGAARAGHLHALADAARTAAHGLLDVHVVLAGDTPEVPDGLLLPYARDAAGSFRTAWAPADGEAFVVRPDGYLAARLPAPTAAALSAHLRRTFRRAPGRPPTPPGVVGGSA
ncbi:2-polyprenyl-6-methoxyphenol hydroxylase [Streptomyces sp. TLI_053]|uniref:FAD-dependent monooxygenase n=1 Tax=Streptomyces sp. TLI_053 TaxID=1855352 RepID=UPI00087A77D7|nr:FAD-dependent monooxygenase [Streptomyces sp. TLI_053]SDT19004.1 2-polyprenyl-6-methoxyphenol hydroxylase [Streptomyces sp. TLI_053]